MQAVLRLLPEGHYHQGVKIVGVESANSGLVYLEKEGGEKEAFDHVVFATHADQTLEILKKGGGVTEDEERILSAFEFSKNRAVLHADVQVSFFPPPLFSLAPYSSG